MARDEQETHHGADLGPAGGHRESLHSLPGLASSSRRIHLITLRSLLFYKQNDGEGLGESEPSYTVGGNVLWCSHYGEQHGDTLKNEK